MGAHALEGQTGIEQPGQRLEPRQPRRRARPAPRQENRLRRQRAVERRGPVRLGATQQEQRVMDRADQPPPGGVRVSFRFRNKTIL